MNLTIPSRLPFKIVIRYEVSRIIELHVLCTCSVLHRSFLNCIYLLLKGTYKKRLCENYIILVIIETKLRPKGNTCNAILYLLRILKFIFTNFTYYKLIKIKLNSEINFAVENMNSTGSHRQRYSDSNTELNCMPNVKVLTYFNLKNLYLYFATSTINSLHNKTIKVLKVMIRINVVLYYR